jgi:hypothetical protein
MKLAFRRRVTVYHCDSPHTRLAQGPHCDSAQCSSGRTSTQQGPLLRTVELLNPLDQEKTKGKAGQIAGQLGRSDLLILDELGCCRFARLANFALPPAQQALWAHQRRDHRK